MGSAGTTSTAGNDTFIGDNATFGASDTLNGGAGTDTLNYTDASTTGVNPLGIVTGVELINIRNVNGTPAVAAVSEKATVTFADVTVTGTATSTIVIAGVTATIGAGTTVTITAAQIAAAFATGAVVTGLAISGTTFTNYTAAAGNIVGSTVFTSTVAGNVVNLTTSGTVTVAPAIAVVEGVPVSGGVAIPLTVNAANFTGATDFNSNLSTGAVTFTGLVAGQSVGKIGGSADLSFTHGATVAAGVLNISAGSTAGAITQTGAGITSDTINSTGAANTVGAIVLSGTANAALTINATTALTTTGITGMVSAANTATITVSGVAANTSTSGAVNLGTLQTAIGTLNASGLTVGGVSAIMSNGAIVVTGGTGNDFITSAGSTFLTTGTLNAGAGTGDRLTLTSDVATLAQGNKYLGFEVIGLAAGAAQDMDLLATNNTFTGMRVAAGTVAATNVNAATAANVLVLGNSTLTVGVKGALTPGQADTVNLTVSDGVAGLTVFTLTTPVLAGVENLGLIATDSITVSSLASATALTNLNVSGAGNVVVTTGTNTLQTNFALNAGTATGNLTFDATNSSVNGFSVVGSSGINTITGGAQVFAVNLAASTAKADIALITSATGGSLTLANATITGFTNSANVLVGDKVDVLNTGAVGGTAVAVAASSTDATVSAALSATGILTFTGTGAAAATLATKIAIATEAAYGGATINRISAFEHAGNTYIVENGDTNAGFIAGTDFVVNLVGVTGVTALSATASAATTVWVV